MKLNILPLLCALLCSMVAIFAGFKTRLKGLHKQDVIMWEVAYGSFMGTEMSGNEARVAHNA